MISESDKAECVHLHCGIVVCGVPRAWCGVKAIMRGRDVLNMTDTPERTTCSECKVRHEFAVALATKAKEQGR